MLEELDEKLDRYNLSYETVAPKNEQTIKKFQKQKLYTDTGHRDLDPDGRIQKSRPCGVYHQHGRDNLGVD